MLYLLAHLAQLRTPMSKGLSHTPWTEYIRFLPRSIPIPTLWTEPERLLLNGTSLEVSFPVVMSPPVAFVWFGLHLSREPRLALLRLLSVTVADVAHAFPCMKKLNHG